MISVHQFRKSKNHTGINIAPLIDMVFILLIFFLVTTSFVRETGMEVNRPKAETASLPEKGNILISVTRNGAIYMNNRQVDIHSVEFLVRKSLNDLPEAEVIVIADEKSYTGAVTKVIDECRKAGIKKVNIAAEKVE